MRLTLVYEAYIRLVGSENAQHWNSRGHFFAAAAEAMRRIVLDRARAKRRKKRGGGGQRMEIDLGEIPDQVPGIDLLALDEELEAARVVATIVVDSQVFADQALAIEHFAPLLHGGLLLLARRRIHRCHVVDAAFGADDALEEAHLTLLEAMRSGKIDSIETEEGFAKLVRHKLHQAVLHERAREGRRRRGGSGSANRHVVPAVRDLDADLEAIASHTPPPDEQLIADDGVERRLALLEVQDHSLRVVAEKKADGFTHRQIAAHLGLPLSAVNRMVRQIQAILGRRDPDAD